MLFEVHEGDHGGEVVARGFAVVGGGFAGELFGLEVVEEGVDGVSGDALFAEYALRGYLLSDEVGCEVVVGGGFDA